MVYLKLCYKELNAHKAEPFLFSRKTNVGYSCFNYHIGSVLVVLSWLLKECSIMLDTDLYGIVLFNM